MAGKPLIGTEAPTVTFGGLKYKLAYGRRWHCWDPKPGGKFVEIDEDAVPGEVWAQFAKQALLNGLTK